MPLSKVTPRKLTAADFSTPERRADLPFQGEPHWYELEPTARVRGVRRFVGYRRGLGWYARWLSADGRSNNSAIMADEGRGSSLTPRGGFDAAKAVALTWIENDLSKRKDVKRGWDTDE